MLLTETKLFDKSAVLLQIGPLEILQQTPALADEDQQAPLTGLVLLESFAMLGELIDPLRKQGNLHFRGSGVFFALAELAYQGSYTVFG
jgi:hypothetical protein